MKKVKFSLVLISSTSSCTEKISINCCSKEKSRKGMQYLIPFGEITIYFPRCSTLRLQKPLCPTEETSSNTNSTMKERKKSWKTSILKLPRQKLSPRVQQIRNTCISFLNC